MSIAEIIVKVVHMGAYGNIYRYIYEVGKVKHEDKAGCGFKNYRKYSEFIGRT